MGAAANRAAQDEVGALPLNERIALALTEKIAAEDYRVGGSLPPETELCATYGASRFTIREALRKLSERGLIARRQGAGSTVVSRTPRAPYGRVFKDLQDLFEYATDTRLDVQDASPAALDEEEAGHVRAPVGSRWLKIVGVRTTEDRAQAISFVNCLVHARFAPLLSDVRTARGAIYGLVEARSGEEIAEAIQEISSHPMPPRAAKALGLARGTPAMRFVRRYCDASGGTMLASINWHAAQNFTYTMRIRRGEWRP